MIDLSALEEMCVVAPVVEEECVPDEDEDDYDPVVEEECVPDEDEDEDDYDDSS